MRVAIITENFLPKLDGVTRTLAMLLEHLQAGGHQVLLLGPESGMGEYAGAEIVGTAGVPFPFYPELRMNFFRPLFVRRLKAFSPDVVHLVDPVILGAAGLASGLPVVGLLSEGVCDLVTDGYTGLLDIQRLCEDEQVTSYRKHLTYLTHNHVARHTMGQAGLVEAQRRSWAQAMDCLVQGYHEVAESTRTLIAA